MTPPCFAPTGLFGTGIQSYFTFLRFLLLLNLLTLLLNTGFVLLPLVWLGPPEPGPDPKLSECCDCPDPVGLSLGMLHGLALDSHECLPTQPQTSQYMRVEAMGMEDRVACVPWGPCPDGLLFLLSRPPVLRQPSAPEGHAKVPQPTLEYFNWQGK